MADENLTTETAQAVAAAPPSVDGDKLKPGQSVLEKLQTLPDVVRRFLLSPALAATHKTIFDRHKVSEDDRDIVYYTELQTFFGEIPVAQFPDKVWFRLDWEDDREDAAAALLADILGEVFVPAQAFVGDVTAMVSDLGGDLASYKSQPLETRVVSYAEAAREIAEASGLELDVDMKKRLAHIIESRLRAVRDDAETREMFMKPKKTGGLELTDGDADRVMDVLSNKTRMTSFVESTEVAPGEGEAMPEPPPPQKELSAIEIKRIYSGTAPEQEAITKRMNRFRQVTEGDIAKMRDAYHQVLFPPDQRPTDPQYVVAGLLVMAEGDRFTDAVEQDDRYKTILRLWLGVNGHEDEVAAYEEDPTDPHFMNMLLQLILSGIAGYDENDSARFALRITNALKKQGHDRYNLVAFDMTKGAFTWKDVIEL